ncbi:hypothetical protein [Pedobacter sp. SYP-B3415]|uniref:hypothetical protein n=1 Tax=Pedobacter sp. SYP-B3415 TaxID=2496641 RepID=UPI00101DD694|nr:hypothetical protein [Pedobacter sp. SYP-B3415]
MRSQFRKGLVCMIAALILIPIAALLRASESFILAGRILLGFGMVLEVVGLALVLSAYIGGKKSK